MRRWAKKLTTILATGYILFFYSERMFWSFLRPGDTLLDLLLTWMVYSLLAWIFLLLVRQCRVAAFPALFLAGAVFGWLAEGVVVDTLYGNAGNPFPASISFTGLAWHALISVGIGWYAQAKVLAAGKPARVVLFAAGVGLAWGLWAGWWPSELGRATTSLAAFALHTLACSIPMIGAWLVLGMASSEWFRPAKYEMAVLLAIPALFFLAVRFPATPRSALILPALLGCCAYELRRNQRQETRPDLLEAVAGQIRPRFCPLLLLIPATAIAAYAPVAMWGLALPTNWILYLITMPLGFACLLGSLWAVHHGTRKTRGSTEGNQAGRTAGGPIRPWIP